MSGDSYQAIYDAVRRQIGAVDIERVAREAFDISWAVSRIEEAAKSAAYAFDRPCVVFRAVLTQHPEGWKAKYGDCIGVGENPDAAMWDFDKNWRGKIEQVSA